MLLRVLLIVMLIGVLSLLPDAWFWPIMLGLGQLLSVVFVILIALYVNLLAPWKKRKLAPAKVQSQS